MRLKRRQPGYLWKNVPNRGAKPKKMSWSHRRNTCSCKAWGEASPPQVPNHGAYTWHPGCFDLVYNIWSRPGVANLRPAGPQSDNWKYLHINISHSFTNLEFLLQSWDFLVPSWGISKLILPTQSVLYHRACAFLTCSTCNNQLVLYESHHLYGWDTTFYNKCVSCHQLKAEFPSSKLWEQIPQNSWT